ncbi:MAG: radical SAM protein, partial [bacterium]
DVLSRAPWIDFLVRGEPEQTIVSLVDTLSSGQEWRCIPGLAYPRNGAEPFIGEKSKPIDDLDSLPMSAHEMLPIAHYFSPYAKRFPMTCLITSRGCRYKCLFCTAPTLSQGRWRGRSPSKVVEEIRYVLTLGAREMFVRDETFTINRARAMEICDRITHTRLRPSWYCFSRVDTVDKATLKIMREAGCHLIIYGIESGNQRVLDLNKKGITLEQSRAAVRLTKECGMRVGTSMMIGMYGDTRESIRDTIRFIRELDPEYGGFTIATPFPGSEFLSVARREGLIGDVRPDRCLYLGDSVLSLPDLGPHEIKKLLTTAYLSYYLRRCRGKGVLSPSWDSLHCDLSQ